MSKGKQQKGNGGKAPQKEFDEALIELSRVTKVTAGGRQLKFRAAVVIGNRKGKVGLGVGKSNEVTGAIQKAVNKAKKSMIRIPLVENTIPHDIQVKLKSAKVLIMPAFQGTGIIAGSSIRQILEIAGVKDVFAKRFGTKNKLNNAKATMKALSLLRENPFLRKSKQENPKKTVEVQVSDDKKYAPKVAKDVAEGKEEVK